MLVPSGSPEAVAREVLRCCATSRAGTRCASARTCSAAKWSWDNVAHRYLETFRDARRAAGVRRVARLRPADDGRRAELPTPKLDHLKGMTDRVGLFQHACFTLPKFSEGYCIDDNARALLLTVLLEEDGMKTPELSDLANSYAAFVNYAVRPRAPALPQLHGLRPALARGRRLRGLAGPRDLVARHLRQALAPA